MKNLLLVIMVGLLVGCGKKPNEQSVSDQERPDVTNPSKPSAKTEAQIEAENKAFAETKGKAEAGNAAAQYNLGNMYSNGEGVAEDDKEAAKWYRLAADQGDADAQYNLGVMYDEGEGVAEDDKEAVKWYRLAADQGDVDAQYNIMVFYAQGRGVLEDYVAAYAWANVVIANGIDVKKFKELLEKKMTPEQIAEAEALAKKMIKKNPKLINK